jgi:hypothetical protein
MMEVYFPRVNKVINLSIDVLVVSSSFLLSASTFLLVKCGARMR